jgi:hypothetical protein
MSRRFVWILAVFWIGLLANTAVFSGDHRFRLPLAPLVAIGAGLLLAELHRQARGHIARLRAARKRRDAPPPVRS